MLQAISILKHKKTILLLSAFSLFMQVLASTDFDDAGKESECITNIIKGNYASAAYKIDLIKDYRKIWHIVKEVVSNNLEANFDYLLKFGEIVTDLKKKILIYRALYNELESNGRMDSLKLLRIMKHVSKIDSSSMRNETFVDVNNLLASLEDSMEHVLKAKLSGNILAGYKSFNMDDIALLNDIGNYNELIVMRVIDSTIMFLFDFDNIEEILLYFNSYPNLTIRCWTILSMYNAITEYSSLNTQLSFTLGFAIKILTSDANFGLVPLDIINDLETVRNKLPECAKNAIFAEKVLIKNVHWLEHLFAENVINDSNVFTWIPRDNINKDAFYWTLQPHRNNFLIKNVALGEYLYASDDYFDYSNDRRRVFTKILDDSSRKQFEWKLEITRSYCYIKNDVYDEYYYAAKNFLNYDADRRITATWATKSYDTQMLWKIEDANR